MEIAFGVAALGIVSLLLGFAPFEAALGLLLLTPIMAFPLGSLMGPGIAAYALGFALIFAVLLCFRPKREHRLDLAAALSALAPLLLFIISFSLFSYLCHLWPDFYPLGERLRDHALVAGVIRSPIDAQEPWLAGAPLNYYLYWYRFGHFLHTVFGLPMWEVYHQLQSFTFALFTSTIFVLLRTFAGLPAWAALAAAFVISLGSNVEGVRHFVTGNDYWWGPSRVIPGAINEFPAWSFLLGDVHPHYLNLGLPPFLILMFLRAAVSDFSAALRLSATAVILFSGTLWVYNANAWEVPVWVGLSGFVGALLLISVPREDLANFFKRRLSRADFLSSRCLLVLGLGVYLCVSLGISALNIVPASMELKLVGSPIARTSALELLRHWGIPLVLMYAACLARINRREWWVCGIFALAAALFSGSALTLLVIIFALNLYRLFVVELRGSARPSVAGIAFESLGIVALGLIVFPELLFFDDSYGGENERMNTIFKAYSAAWFLLHAFVFYLAARLSWKRVTLNWHSPWVAGMLVIGILWCGFFFRTIKIRKHAEPFILPHAQGLSELERRFPGSSTAIQVLANSWPGIVLEAQGPAYDVTTHVATLSGQPAYLGWANHVNLLLRMYDEVNRRTQMTNQIYQEPDCAKKLTLTAQERIKYVVLGPLEKRAYPGISAESFACFKTVAKAKEYTVFAN